MTKYLRVTVEVVEEVHDGPMTTHRVLDAHPQRWLLEHPDRGAFLNDVGRMVREVARDMVEDFS